MEVRIEEYRKIIIGVVVILLAVITTYYLYDMERRHQEALKRYREAPLMDIQPGTLESQGSRDLTVEIYFCRAQPTASTADLLVAESRTIFQTDDPILKSRQIISELFKGPTGAGLPILSDQAKLRQVHVLEDGTAIVDLSRAATSELKGAIGEFSAIQAITRSLTRNVPQIQRVKFLVDGHEQVTLAGHISIRNPFM